MSKRSQNKTISLFTAGVITTISITLVLFLLGLTFLVGFTAKGFSSYLKEKMMITIELEDKMPEGDIAKMQKELELNPYVKSVEYINKDQVKKDLIKALGKDPDEVVGYYPWHSYLDVYIKADYVNIDSMKMVQKSFEGKKLIKNVTYNEEDIANANSNLSVIGSVLLIFAGILILISFVLIRSIIQLNIYSKRFLINTMQLVGATNAFIRRPFVWSMVGCGIIASILANIGITGAVYYITSAFPESISIVSVNELLIVYAMVLVSGILITAFATVSAVNRYLRMTTNKLYRA